MNNIFSIILGSYRQIYFVVAGMLIALYSLIIRKNSKLKIENEALNLGIEEIKNESSKIITIQKKQCDIASRPSASRDDIHEQLLVLSRKSKRDDK
jgi:hypothetical protein